MKHNKLLFNTFLFSYKKCVRKLKNLQIRNTNFRKQEILGRKLKKLQTALFYIKNSILKTTSLAAIAGAVFVLNPTDGNAQTFLPAEVNPFSIEPSLEPLSNYVYGSAFADIDADGDLDMMLSSFSGFLYYENEGDSENPTFSTAQLNPFSLVTTFNDVEIDNPQFSFVDIDNDGDFDIISGSLSYGNFYYFQNTGTSTIPNFSAPEENPFGLSPIIGSSNFYSTSASFADLDDDGVLDMLSDNDAFPNSFLFYKNIGTATTPSFAAGISNPYSIVFPEYTYTFFPSFGDLDQDGDFDILSTNYYGGAATFVYFENIGTSLVPSFGTMQTDPFLLGENFDYILNPTASFADLDSDGDLDIMAGTYGIYDAETYTYNFAMFYFENASCKPIVVSNQLNQLSVDSTAGNTYQWLNCNSGNTAIAGEISPTFNPSESGSYALTITTIEGCTDTSACFSFTLVGLNENLLSNKIQLFPNPAQNKINLILDRPINKANIEIKSITGQVIFEQKNTTGINFLIDISNQTKGLYFLEVIENGNISRVKFAKE